MVSLGSKARKFARSKSPGKPINTVTVASSKLEADHFMKYGKYKEKNILITGLPKLDRSYKNNNSKKITIMPTWRPWEYNIVRVKPEESNYYKMIIDIINSIPSKYRSNIHVLPHPLFARELKDTNLKRYIKEYDSYDKVLQDTEVLITDYSSIAYDAFYRGSKVIFWWKEKDYCMERYGGFLMINEDNIFGDIVYNKDDMSKIIGDNYKNSQLKLYIDSFKRIVEFNDGKNTDRLIKMLESNQIIKRK